MKNQGALITAGAVIAAIGIGGYIVYAKFFAPKLQPIGGLKGAGQVSMGLNSIVGGAQQLAQPLMSIWKNLVDGFSPNGQGSAPQNQAIQPYQYPTNANSIPAWLKSSQTAVNTAGNIDSVIRDISRLGT